MTVDQNPSSSSAAEQAAPKPPPKDLKKKKDEKKDEDLSDEDLALKQQLELYVDRVQDPDHGVQKLALESMRQEIRTSTSSMTSVPKPLKFLRPHYGTLKSYFETMPESELKKYLADILSVLALTMSAEGERESLKYRLLGSEGDIGSWGHEYVRNLAGEISQEFAKRQYDDMPIDALMELVQQIVAFHMKHNAEPEAVDLLMEVEDLDLLVEHVDKTNYKRTCLYLKSSSSFLPSPDDMLALDIAFTIYIKFNDLTSALNIALFLDNIQYVKQIFTSTEDLLLKMQFCYNVARHGLVLELDDEMVADDDDRETLQDIVNNVKLSEGYLTLARDIEVMEPKSPEDIYKVHLIEGRASASSSLDSARQNLAATFVNAFVNAGFGQDKLMTVPAESSSGSSGNWLFKNKDHGKTSAAASLGMILLWDVDSGLSQIDKYLHSTDNHVAAGALLGVGIVNCGIKNDCDPALALLIDYVHKEDTVIRTGAILGLGIAYAGSHKDEIRIRLTQFLGDSKTPLDVLVFSAITLGLVYVGSCNEEIAQTIILAIMERSETELGEPLTRLLPVALGLLYLGKQESVEATAEVSKTFNEKIRKHCDVTLLSMAYAGTGNVLKVQQLLGYCAPHLEKGETHQGPAVLGIALVAMAEELGLEMAIRSLEHLLQYGEQNIRRAVPLALGILCISNPKVNVMDTLSRLSHDADADVSMAAIISLGLIGAGTNNARIAGMLRNLSSYYYKEAGQLFCVRIAQGLVHMGKGLLTLSPYHSDRFLLSPTALAGLVTVLFACLDLNLKLDCFIPIRRTHLLHRPRLNLNSLFKTSRISVRVSNRINSNQISGSNNPSVPTEPHKITGTESRASNNSEISDEIQKETEDILEWPSVCSQVSAFASTAIGRARCRGVGLRIGRSRDESEKLLEQTKAAVLLPNPLDFSGVDDVSEILRAAVDGELLMIPQLCAVGRSIRAARRVFEQLEHVSNHIESSYRFTPLLEILQNCDFVTELVNKLEFCIDCTLSTIPDRASARLTTIRSERKRNAEKLESFLKEVSVKVSQAGGIDSPLVTRRRFRMCVGIKASHKSLLPEGIVLSVSSSGATYFMEPRDAIELNNMEVRLSNSERDEELAILGFLSSEVAVSETKIRHLMEKILELDIACARGAYAQWMDGVRPVLCEGNEKIALDKEVLSVDIEGIHHPLLLEPSLRSLSSVSLSDAGSSKLLNAVDESLVSENLPGVESPVPLDIKIGHATRVVVISGPNTGGKTATMKTLGLASIMSKAGMFLPAKNVPRLPWFDQILADIGDHQSLEHNLSTFSSHISRLCKIIDVVSEDSLVLIDEIGSGTDPSEGVALSTSVLQHLADCVNLALVTTHYADLSHLKTIDSRFENAAMEFCIETLRPTYRIMWGSTGNSNALSIATSIGFDQKVLNRAHEWVEKLMPDKQKERQGFLYQSLLEEMNLLEAQAHEAASVLAEVKKLHHEIYSEAAHLDRREDALKAKEVRRLQLELETATSQMDAVIKNFEIRLQNADADQFNLIIRESEAAISSIVTSHQLDEDKLFEATGSQQSYMPKVGDTVNVRGLGAKLATVLKVGGEDGTTMVRYGKINVRVKRSDLRPLQGNPKHTPRGSSSNLKQVGQGRLQTRATTKENKAEEPSFGPAVRTSKNTVDLRGLRAEEASHILRMAIAGCKPYGVLFVIHGTGTGVLKEQAIRILKNHPRVAKYEEESPMNYGCTVAYVI